MLDGSRPRVHTEPMVTVAAVQATPVFLDREATTDKVCALVHEAASHGAELIVFPESFIPAYPDWVWRTPAWRDGEFVQRLYANAVSVPGPALQRVQDAAAEASAYVVVGVTEIEGGTLYNSSSTWGPTGGCCSGTASSCRPAGSGRCGAWATARSSASCRRRSGWSGVAVLGELHAVGPGGDLRAALRHLPGSDLGQQRHVGGQPSSRRAVT